MDMKGYTDERECWLVESKQTKGAAIFDRIQGYTVARDAKGMVSRIGSLSQ